MKNSRSISGAPAHARGAMVSAVAGLAMLVSWTLLADEGSPRHFDSAESAVKALVGAMGEQDTGPVIEILGRRYESELVGGDAAAAATGMRLMHAAALERVRLHEEADDRVAMILGFDAWPLPFPIVHREGAWQFDTEAGLDEVISRRIGRNELSAIDVARIYVAAQRLYASKDRDGDEVLEYAQQIASSPGATDGLYWEPGPETGEEPSPFGPFVADAREYLEGREPGDPYRGYYFKVLTRQGEGAPGGRYDYVINGNMLAGFALVAYPADYGNSGVMTFVVNHLGNVHQRDLGDNTTLLAAAMESYDRNDFWTGVED